MKKNSLTIVEITDSFLKIMQLKEQRGKKAVSYLDIQPIKVFNDSEISNQLKAMVASKKTTFKNIIGVIPRRFVILKHVSLPSQQDDEIKKMINLQVVTNVPYPREDIVFDYHIVDKGQSGYSQVLVIIVHKEVVSRYTKMFSAANLNVTQLTLSSMGVVEWYKHVCKKEASEPVSLLHFDATHSEICFYNNGNLLFSRNVNFGIKDLDEVKIDGFIKQLHLTLETYQKDKMGPAVVKIVILSSNQSVSMIEQKVIHNTQIPVQVIQTLDHLIVDKGIDIAKLSEGSVASVCVLGGLLFSTKSRRINLMSDEEQYTKISKQKMKKVFRAGVMFIIACLFGLAALFSDYYQDSLYLKKIETKTSSLKDERLEANKKIRFIQFFDDHVNNRVLIAELFYHLYELTPSDIAYKKFIVDSDGLISINGLSQNAASVNDFQANLANSALFEQVNLQYTNKQRFFNQELTDFKLTFRTNKKKR